MGTNANFIKEKKVQYIFIIDILYNWGQRNTVVTKQ